MRYSYNKREYGIKNLMAGETKMKISDGNWLIQQNFTVMNPMYLYDVKLQGKEIVAYVAPREVTMRENQLDTLLFTYTFSSPQEGIIGIRSEHFKGNYPKPPLFSLNKKEEMLLQCTLNSDDVKLQSGELTVVLEKKGVWKMDFFYGGRPLTSSLSKAAGYIEDIAENQVYMFDRLSLGVGESVYGLGEHFTAFTKNGQSVEMWNRDGGTSTEQAYKNIPFYLTNRGYGVFVNHPEKVSFEVASEKVSSVQFSVPGENLEYYVIGGANLKQVLSRYTNLTGRPPLPPAWSFGLWLSTSFTTKYDETTVNHFIDGMKDRALPVHVFHFDCFWMKAFQWCDFSWDSEVFPNPQAMLERLKTKGLKICVWINPYISQQSKLFVEGMQNHYFIEKKDGNVWQWDKWQPGQAVVDFTNPKACQWYAGCLSKLIDMGVDCFKTDFGERIPVDVNYYDHADPQKMHNYYTYLYNKVVYDVLKKKKGEEEAVLFARSATVGCQMFPVHWGGDCYGTYESMAESLRGGLSLGLSGFGFWSHDIGGFENTSPADVYKRWCAFGLLSSHSRLHGSKSYRVPWVYDEQAVDVLRFFTNWKCRLMPYFYHMAAEAHEKGLPVMRAMVLEFPEDPGCEYLDQQYMLGESILVAPVLRADHIVKYYLPKGKWTHLFTGKVVWGGSWFEESYDFLSLPIYVRENTILAIGANDQRPDYDYTEGLELHVFNLQEGQLAQTRIINLQGKCVLDIKIQQQANRYEMVLTKLSKPCTCIMHGIESIEVCSSDSIVAQTIEQGCKLKLPVGLEHISFITSEV
jgi:alpha-D-xyloside xylohydrolase